MTHISGDSQNNTAGTAAQENTAQKNAAHILPPLADIMERAQVVALPLRVPFRGLSVREALIFEGSRGWAEWAPFVEYDVQESSRWLRSALLQGYGVTPAETPAQDPLTSRPIEVNATIPAVDVRADPEAIDRLMQRYPGCTTVKVKVAEAGQSMDDDLARIRAVRAWFENNARSSQGTTLPTPKIRLDANGAWSVDEAVQIMEIVAAEGVFDYAEQPCSTVQELRELRSRLMRRGIFARVAADEVIRKDRDPAQAVREVVDAGACDVVVLKVAPLGGVDRVLEIAESVAKRGVAVTVSSAMDTAVGIGAGLEAAGRLTRIIEVGDDEGVVVHPQPAGLATGSLFVHDLAERPIVDGCMMSGACVPDPERLEEFRVNDQRKDWWFQRLTESYELLRA